jgi:hypothetical protein
MDEQDEIIEVKEEEAARQLRSQKRINVLLIVIDVALVIYVIFELITKISTPVV